MGGGSMGELTTDEIVRLMIGDVRINEGQKPESVTDRPLLQVQKMGRVGVIHGIDLTLHQGEVLGLWGSLARDVPRSPAPSWDSTPVRRAPSRSTTGMACVRSAVSRHSAGSACSPRIDQTRALQPLSVASNMSLANLRALGGRVGFVDRAEEARKANALVDRLAIKISGLGQAVETLSGGNQQKVVVGRWLEVNPRIFIMDEPTRGLDVGAKAEIRRIILELAESGAGVLVILSEIEEIMAVCHRYLVMNRGRIVEEMGGDATKEELMAAAAGVEMANRFRGCGR